MPEERKSYIIVRKDGLVLHTKPVTREEAGWLCQDAYKDVRDRAARIRYLEEWGSVLDVGDSADYLRQQLERLGYDLYLYIGGVYEGPENLEGKASQLLGLKKLRPEARQALEGLLNKIKEFYQRPVEPKPIGPQPVRYLEMGHQHVEFERIWIPTMWGVLADVHEIGVDPEPEWYAYKKTLASIAARGVSVFKDSFWLWIQTSDYTEAVAVRRDASDEEVVNAVAKDGAALDFLKCYAHDFRDIINRYEDDMKKGGYEDVVRKAKAILASVESLTAG